MRSLRGVFNERPTLHASVVEKLVPLLDADQSGNSTIDAAAGACRPPSATATVSTGARPAAAYLISHSRPDLAQRLPV